MSTPVKVLATAAFVVICALGAAQLLQHVRHRATAHPVSAPTERVDAEPPDESSPPPARDYSGIAQRDLFRPLVAALKTGEGGGGEASTAGGQAAGERAKPGNVPGRPSGATSPADPLADLALTGVVQVGQRLQVLIEKLSTRTGRYVALNEEYEGFKVVLIGESSAVLERDGKQYTLRMGGRELADESRAAALAGAPTPTAPQGPPGGGGPGGPGGMPGGGMGGFSGDMLSWAESQSLEDLERMYGQYGQYLSPQDRARAEAYLEQRRARERG